MKKLIVLSSFLVIANFVLAQIPHLEVQDKLGDTHVLADYMEDDKHYLLSFWASWCYPCKKEFDAWKAYASVWQDQYNVEIIAISIDDPDAIKETKALWRNRDWEGHLLFTSSDSARAAFNVNGIPRVFLFDDTENLLYDHGGFSSGDEIELDEFIKNHFNIVGVAAPTQSEKTTLLYQDNQSIHITLSEPLTEGRWAIYSIAGERMKEEQVESNATAFSISKSRLTRHQLYALEVVEGTWRNVQWVFIE